MITFKTNKINVLVLQWSLTAIATNWWATAHDENLRVATATGVLNCRMGMKKLTSSIQRSKCKKLWWTGTSLLQSRKSSMEIFHQIKNWLFILRCRCLRNGDIDIVFFLQEKHCNWFIWYLPKPVDKFQQKVTLWGETINKKATLRGVQNKTMELI